MCQTLGFSLKRGIAEPSSQSTLLTEESTANKLAFPKSGSLHSPDPLEALPGF